MRLLFSMMLLALPFILPIIFQLILGQKRIKRKTTLKMWQIGVISIAIMCAFLFLLDILVMRPATARTHEGLAYIGLAALGIITLVIILIISVVQYLIQNRKQKFSQNVLEISK